MCSRANKTISRLPGVLSTLARAGTLQTTLHACMLIVLQKRLHWHCVTPHLANGTEARRNQMLAQYSALAALLQSGTFMQAMRTGARGSFLARECCAFGCMYIGIQLVEPREALRRTDTTIGAVRPHPTIGGTHTVCFSLCAVGVEDRSPASPEFLALFRHHPHVYDVIRYAEFLATTLPDLLLALLLIRSTLPAPHPLRSEPGVSN